MKYEVIKKLIINIIENEFVHIQEHEEVEYTKIADQEVKVEVTNNILDRVKEALPKEKRELAEELEAAFIDEWVNMCKFYFKAGVRAGLTNLKFLNDVNGGSVLQYGKDTD